jgi:hypothetical protein
MAIQVATEGDALMIPPNGLLKNGRRDTTLSVTSLLPLLVAAVVGILEVEVLLFCMNLLRRSVFALRNPKVLMLTTKFL